MAIKMFGVKITGMHKLPARTDVKVEKFSSVVPKHAIILWDAQKAESQFELNNNQRKVFFFYKWAKTSTPLQPQN